MPSIFDCKKKGTLASISPSIWPLSPLMSCLQQHRWLSRDVNGADISITIFFFHIQRPYSLYIFHKTRYGLGFDVDIRVNIISCGKSFEGKKLPIFINNVYATQKYLMCFEILNQPYYICCHTYYHVFRYCSDRKISPWMCRRALCIISIIF